MMITAELVKEFARDEVDMIGIASANQFRDAPKGHKPADLLPGAKSVVVVGIALPKSVVKTAPSVQFVDYCETVEMRLRIISQKIALFLEKEGGDAFPFSPGGYSEDIPLLAAMDIKVVQENPEPVVIGMDPFSHRHAAVLAGMGEISAGGYVVVPGFGPRIRFASIITTNYLEPDPLLKKDFSWGLLCRPDLCKLQCKKICPSKAIQGDGTVSLYRCRHYRNPKQCTLDFFKEMEELRIKGVSAVQRAYIVKRKYPPHVLGRCYRCNHACPVGLKQGFGPLEKDVRKMPFLEVRKQVLKNSR